MDHIYQHASSETLQPLVYNGDYVETPPFTSNRPPSNSTAREQTQADHTASRWTPSGEYDGHPCGFRGDFFLPSPGGRDFGKPRSTHPYGFDASVPPPPFGCSPSGHFRNVVTTAPINAYSNREASTFQPFPKQFRACLQATQYDLDPSLKQQRKCEDFPESGALLDCPLFPPHSSDGDRDWSPAKTARPEDETVLQRRQDQQWLGRFLQGRDKTFKSRQTERQQQPHRSSVPELRAALTRAAQLASQMVESCATLRTNVENGCVWADSYAVALNVKRELQDKLQDLSGRESLDSWKDKLLLVAKRRARRQRARKLLHMEEKHRRDRVTEKEAAINTWRMQQIHQVEEKKKKQELKLAADSVLCEVRKKQTDVKRMQDILRSLEKLRRLRKEAALKKGVITEQECDEAFSDSLKHLRYTMKKRTAIYSAEEKALVVMLEGEQEEKRRRQQEKRVKKEKERHLQRNHRVNAMLFGDKHLVDSVLQPFREYCTQTERSLHALLQIRREWDMFVVPADHPNGSVVPQSWILPDAPSDPAWASAVCAADTE